MLKNVVLHVSGIVKKQVEFFQTVNDFNTYVLREELTNFQNNYTPEEQERYKDTLNIYVEIDNHLFYVCRVNHIEELKEYNQEKIMNYLIENFNENVEMKKSLSLGMAQYLNRVNEYEEIKQYRADNEKQKREEKERIKEEKRLQQEKELNDQLEIELQRLLNNEKIYSEDFVALCDKYNVKLPLRTRGWALNSLHSISKTQMSYSGNRSSVIFRYVEQLVDAVQNKTA